LWLSYRRYLPVGGILKTRKGGEMLPPFRLAPYDEQFTLYQSRITTSRLTMSRPSGY
jgi:hypothetical protein